MQEGVHAWIGEYKGRYYTTNTGDVYSVVKSLVGVKLKGAISNGYKVVLLTHADGVSELHYVARLVATAFLPNPDNKPLVLFKDGDTLNTHVNNLMWGDYCDRRKSVPSHVDILEDDVLLRKYAVNEFLVTGKSRYIKDREHFLTHVTPEDFKAVGVPPEIVKVACTKGSYLNQWLWVLKIVPILRSTEPLSEVASTLGLSVSAVSRLRNGSRGRYNYKLFDRYVDMYNTRYV